MIHLFDKCFLALPKQVDEKVKHVWIGSHPYDQDDYHEHAFEIHDKYETITELEIDSLFNDIHTNLSNQQIIIYCDVENFERIYQFFFSGFLPQNAIDEMYEIDKQKENYNIGTHVYGIFVAGKKDIKHLSLPTKSLTGIGQSNFSKNLKPLRIELALANGLLGDNLAKEYCLDFACSISNGSPGIQKIFVEQTLPAILTDEQYTIENLTNPNFIDEILTNDINEVNGNFMCTQKLSVFDKIKELYDFDFINHFCNVLNENDWSPEICLEYWNLACGWSKKDFLNEIIFDRVHDTAKSDLLFPNPSNFRVMNPILWNKINNKRNDTVWLEKYKVIDGINNKAN
jgi:hypothetical protein